MNKISELSSKVCLPIGNCLEKPVGKGAMITLIAVSALTALVGVLAILSLQPQFSTSLSMFSPIGSIGMGGCIAMTSIGALATAFGILSLIVKKDRANSEQVEIVDKHSEAAGKLRLESFFSEGKGDIAIRALKKAKELKNDEYFSYTKEITTEVALPDGKKEVKTITQYSIVIKYPGQIPCIHNFKAKEEFDAEIAYLTAKFACITQVVNADGTVRPVADKNDLQENQFMVITEDLSGKKYNVLYYKDKLPCSSMAIIRDVKSLLEEKDNTEVDVMKNRLLLGLYVDVCKDKPFK